MSQQASVSAIILSKNEASRIEECLNALSWVNEIIVIDNGSSDESVLIAKKCGAKVMRDETKDFARLRNLGHDHAAHEWLLYIDADEITPTELRTEIQHVIRDNSRKENAYFIRRKNYYLGCPWPYSDRMIRLIRKNALMKWEGVVHEHPIIQGDIGVLTVPLVHNTHRTLEDMVTKTNEWSEVEAKLRFDAGHPPIVWWRFIRVMSLAFFNSFVKQGGWRAGVVGWIESIYQAFSMFITYAKLWEKQQIESQKSKVKSQKL